MVRLVVGPTGDFPEGKLNEDDEGGLMMAVGVEKGHVTINFGGPVRWLALGPAEAIAFANILLMRAQEIKSEKTQ